MTDIPLVGPDPVIVRSHHDGQLTLTWPRGKAQFQVLVSVALLEQMIETHNRQVRRIAELEAMPRMVPAPPEDPALDW